MKQFFAYIILFSLAVTYIPREVYHECDHKSQSLDIDQSSDHSCSIDQSDCDFCSIDLFHVGPVELPVQISFTAQDFPKEEFAVCLVKVAPIEYTSLRGPPVC